MGEDRPDPDGVQVVKAPDERLAQRGNFACNLPCLRSFLSSRPPRSGTRSKHRPRSPRGRGPNPATAAEPVLSGSGATERERATGRLSVRLAHDRASGEAVPQVDEGSTRSGSSIRSPLADSGVAGYVLAGAPRP